MKQKRKGLSGWWLFGLLAIFLPVVLSGCGQKAQNTEGHTYSVYYVSKDYSKDVVEQYVTTTGPDDTNQLMEELLIALQRAPQKKVEELAPLGGNMLPNHYSLQKGQINLDFTDKYKELDVIPEVLYRAAIVRTLTQIKGITTVSFSINGDALTDTEGNPIGTMTADSFIDNAGTEISSYEKAKLHLYFADKAGDGLIEVDREVVYNSNISMEKLIMEELIKGPNNEETYPTINPQTQVLGVTVKDGICYVNLDDAFLNQPYNVTSDVTIYSIADSLSELANVNKVQISVNGETNVTYHDNVNLSTVFERNLDIVKSGN